MSALIYGFGAVVFFAIALFALWGAIEYILNSVKMLWKAIKKK